MKGERELPRNVYANRGSGFYASVRYGGKRVYLGMFDTPEKAEERVAMFRAENPPVKGPRWEPGDKV